MNVSLIAAVVIQSVAVHGTRLPVNLETQVGQPYDMRLIDRDVLHLWATGRFSDIRVKQEGSSIVFDVTEARRLTLHKIVTEPSNFGLQFKAAEGAPITTSRAQEISVEARRQLQAKGYINARVDYDLTPIAANANEVDLNLTIRQTGKVRVKEVSFGPDPILSANELQGALSALRKRRAYNSEALDTDLARVRSLYLSKGYLDAEVRVDDVNILGGDAYIRFLVEPGPLHPVRKDLCACLLRDQRAAQREGILDFSARLAPDQTLHVNHGRAYRVGRIEFSGNHHFGDAMLRRNFLLDEGGVFDERLVRKSVDRLNRTQLFEPIAIEDVRIQSDEAAGVADINVRLTERKRGAWNISGPVGPASFAGPLQGSLSARILSTFVVSLSIAAFVQPILPAWAIASRHTLFPVLSLQRPFSPVGGWLSGFTVAPQLGWRASAFSYGTTQLQRRALPALAGDRSLIPAVTVVVERHSGEAAMFCEPPGPRFVWLRRAASLAIQFF